MKAKVQKVYDGTKGRVEIEGFRKLPVVTDSMAISRAKKLAGLINDGHYTKVSLGRQLAMAGVDFDWAGAESPHR